MSISAAQLGYLLEGIDWAQSGADLAAFAGGLSGFERPVTISHCRERADLIRSRRHERKGPAGR